MVGALAIVLATLTPSSQQITPHSLCLICGELGGVDVVLNVLLYMPLGAGLAMAGVRSRRGVVALGVCSAIIELLQWTIIPGRDGSVGDVVTNTLGALIGFAVGAHVHALLRPRLREGRILVVSWLSFWVALQATAAYAMQPSPTRRPYYGQLARALGDEQGYPGRILSATLDHAPIPDRDMRESRAIHDALARTEGAELDVTMDLPRAPTRRPSVVRIADDGEQEILALTAEDRDLVFDVRTRASDLRLRGPIFRMDTILPRDRDRATSAVAPTFRVQARYALPTITLLATRDGKMVQHDFSPSPGDAWRLIALSYKSYDETAEERAAAAVWLMLLLLPAGYWLIAPVRSVGGSDRHTLRAPLASIGIALTLGLAVVPMLFHMSVATWWELAGAVGGVILGAVLATLASRTRAWQLIRSDVMV